MTHHGRVRDSARWLAPVVLAPAALATLAGPAAADHEFDTMYPVFSAYNHFCYSGTIDNRDRFCLTDNLTMTVFREGSINALGKQRAHDVVEAQFDSGEPLTVNWPDSARYTGDAETDLIMQQGTQMPADDNGFAWCNDAVSIRRCDQHYNQYRYTEVSRRLVCHEVGHSVGMVHGSFSSPALADGDNRLGCMQDPIPLENDGELGTLNRHNLNQEYGTATSTASYDPYQTYKE